MEQVAGGRHCESCQHVVHDFTNMSDCQLKKVLRENPRVCGRFRGSQMRTEFVKYAAATAIVASGVAINSCAEQEVEPLKEPQIEFALPDSIQFESDTISVYTMGIVFYDPEESHQGDTTSTTDPVTDGL
jgi:hypothetical protein